MNSTKAIIGLAMVLVCAISNAQQGLLETIRALEAQEGVRFSFDSELLSAVSEKVELKDLTLDEFIEQISTNYPFQVEKVGDSFYTIAVREMDFALAVTDSLDNTTIPRELGMYVLVNGNPTPIAYVGNEWKFRYKPSLSDKIEVYAPGFDRTQIDVLSLFTGKKVTVSLAMSTINLQTVTVQDYLTKGINLEPSNQSIRVKVSDLPLLPGETDGDIFASIAALPGISSPDGRAGNLYIRGSETDQTLILFDGIPIYHRGHYYGTISPYNPKLVDNVQVYRSGFHAGLGDRVGGAVLIESSGQLLSEPIYGLGANTLFGMGYTKLPISDKLLLSFGARRSLGFESPKLNAISESVFDATAVSDSTGKYTGIADILFEDYHSRLTAALGSKSTLSFSGIYSNTQALIGPIRRPQGESQEENGFTNLGFSSKLATQLSASWLMESTLIWSKYDFVNATQTPTPEAPSLISENIIRDFGWQHRFQRSTRNSTISFGLDLKRQWVDMIYRDVRTNPPPPELVQLNEQVNATTASGYFSHDIDLNKWYFQYGVRATYYDELNDFRLAPRILANYEPVNGVVLKSSYGLYNQYLSQIRNLEFGSGGFDNELWLLASNERARIMNGSQTMVGFTLYNDKWVLDTEYFIKDVADITLYEDRRLVVPGAYITMNQKTQGIDMLLKRRLSNATSAWVGYSYHDSAVKLDSTNQTSFLSKYVQPHVVFLGLSVIKNRWKFSSGWRYASGLNAQSLDIVYAEVIFERMNQNRPPDQRPPNPFEDRIERYPNVHFLDISTSYTIPKNDQRGWSASFGLSLNNVLNQTNLTDQVFRGRDGFIDRYAVGFAPNLMVIVEW